MSNRKKSESRDFESSGLPESYRAQWEANPYAGQSVGGIGAESRKAREELNLNSREYYANLLAQAHAEDYDSAAAQVERLKAAGINPDISGGVSAGESSTAPVEQSGVNFAGSYSESLLGYSDILLNIASLAMSLPSGLRSLHTQNLDEGLRIAEAGDALAKAFPKESKNIAPFGSGLAPVLVDGSVSASRIADAIPNLSKNQRKALAKQIDLNRGSLRSTLSSAKDRYDLEKLLGSPELSMPAEARSILQLQTKLTLSQLKGQLLTEQEIAKHRESIARKSAENQEKALDVESEQLDAGIAESGARRAEAAARGAEAGLRSEIARSTDGTAIGEARTEQAIVQRIEAQTAQEQLQIIEDAEDEGLFNTSLVSDVFYAYHHKKAFRTADKSQADVIWERYKKRRAAKREQKRKYKQSASGSFTFSPKGVSYSE